MDIGQAQFLEKLYREMYSVLLSFADAALEDKALAEEAVQDTFRIASAKMPEFYGSENPQGWLMLTLKNVIRNTRREVAELNRLFVFAMSVDDEAVLESYAADTDFNKRLEDDQLDLLYADLLSPDEYSLLKKIVLQRYTIADAARELEIPVLKNSARKNCETSSVRILCWMRETPLIQKQSWPSPQSFRKESKKKRL